LKFEMTTELKWNYALLHHAKHIAAEPSKPPGPGPDFCLMAYAIRHNLMRWSERRELWRYFSNTNPDSIWSASPSPGSRSSLGAKSGLFQRTRGSLSERELERVRLDIDEALGELEEEGLKGEEGEEEKELAG
jgi:hypothetical protein